MNVQIKENPDIKEKIRLSQFKQIQTTFLMETEEKDKIKAELDKYQMNEEKIIQTQLFEKENRMLNDKKKNLQRQIQKLSQQETAKRIRENFLEEQIKAVLNGYKLKWFLMIYSIFWEQNPVNIYW